MNDLRKYREIFIRLFSLPKSFEEKDVRLNNTTDWDSVGHMELIALVEDTFDIMMDTEDILEFDTYCKGIEILKKYDIELLTEGKN